MVENRTVKGEHALRLAEVVKKFWDKDNGENVEENAKKFEEFLNTMSKLTEELDTTEFKELRNMLTDLEKVLRDAYEFSKWLKAADLLKEFLKNTQRNDESGL